MRSQHRSDFCEPVEGRPLVASRNPQSDSISDVSGSPRRISFAKISEPLEVPDLLSLQIDSFDWLVGNETWQARRGRRRGRGRTDVSGPSPACRRSSRRSPRSRTSAATMSLSFANPVFYDPEEHRRRVQGEGLHLLRAAVRLRRVHEQRDRRDQEPDRLHGRLPADDAQGHLRHQRHRACRGRPSSSARPVSTSSAPPDKTSDKDIFTAKVIPSPRRVAGVRDRQARHGRRPPRPQAQAERHRAAQGARLDRRADPGGVRRLRVDPAHPGEGPHLRARTTRCSTSTASCARASRRRARPRRRCWTTTTSTPSATTWPRSAATRSTRSSAATRPSTSRR